MLWRINGGTDSPVRVALRTCKVVCRDAQNIEHAVEVTAQTLYEAVARALRIFRDDDWRESPEGTPSTVAVKIRSPKSNIR